MTLSAAVVGLAAQVIDAIFTSRYTQGHSARGLLFRSNTNAEELRFRHARGLGEQDSTLE
jgi:hypothetical protein